MVKTPPTLRLGSKSSSVWILETKLRQLGFFKGFPDENFDEQTRQAVIDFQRFSAVMVDGIAGPQTWQVLFGGAVNTLTRPTGRNEQKSRAWIAILAVVCIFGRPFLLAPGQAMRKGGT